MRWARARRVVDAHAKRDIIARTGRAKKSVAIGKLLRICCGSCGSMHLLARFTGDPFRVSDLRPAAALFAEVASVEQLALALFQVSPRPAALVGPRQYRRGKIVTIRRVATRRIRAVLMAGHF